MRTRLPVRQTGEPEESGPHPQASCHLSYAPQSGRRTPAPPHAESLQGAGTRVQGLWDTCSEPHMEVSLPARQGTRVGPILRSLRRVRSLPPPGGGLRRGHRDTAGTWQLLGWAGGGEQGLLLPAAPEWTRWDGMRRAQHRRQGDRCWGWSAGRWERGGGVPYLRGAPRGEALIGDRRGGRLVGRGAGASAVLLQGRRL